MSKTYISEDTFHLRLKGKEKNQSVILYIGRNVIKDDIRTMVDVYGKDLIAAIVNKMLIFIEEYNQQTQGKINQDVAMRNAKNKERAKQRKGGKKPKKAIAVDKKHLEPEGIPIWTYGYISQLFGGLFKEQSSGRHGSELYAQMKSLSPHGIRTAERKRPPYRWVSDIEDSRASAFAQVQNTGHGNMIRWFFHFPIGAEMELKNRYGYHIEEWGWLAITSPYNIKRVLKEMWTEIDALYLYDLFQREIVDKLVASGRFKRIRKKKYYIQ